MGKTLTPPGEVSWHGGQGGEPPSSGYSILSLRDERQANVGRKRNEVIWEARIARHYPAARSKADRAGLRGDVVVGSGPVATYRSTHGCASGAGHPAVSRREQGAGSAGRASSVPERGADWVNNTSLAMRGRPSMAAETALGWNAAAVSAQGADQGGHRAASHAGPTRRDGRGAPRHFGPVLEGIARGVVNEVVACMPIAAPMPRGRRTIAGRRQSGVIGEGGLVRVGGTDVGRSKPLVKVHGLWKRRPNRPN